MYLHFFFQAHQHSAVISLALYKQYMILHFVKYNFFDPNEPIVHIKIIDQKLWYCIFLFFLSLCSQSLGCSPVDPSCTEQWLKKLAEIKSDDSTYVVLFNHSSVLINQERVPILTQLRSHQPPVQLITTRDVYTNNVMMLADLEVIKTLLKRQSQKPINSILSSKDDLKDFTSSKPTPASPSSTLQLSEGDGAIFAPFQPEEFLVNFWNEGKVMDQDTLKLGFRFPSFGSVSWVQLELVM